MKLVDKLSLVKRKVDRLSHIHSRDPVDARLIHCLCHLCPAQVYACNEETGALIIRHENCLECGSCRVVCRDCLTWNYPNAGCGVSHRFG